MAIDIPFDLLRYTIYQFARNEKLCEYMHNKYKMFLVNMYYNYQNNKEFCEYINRGIFKLLDAKGRVNLPFVTVVVLDNPEDNVKHLLKKGYPKYVDAYNDDVIVYANNIGSDIDIDFDAAFMVYMNMKTMKNKSLFGPPDKERSIPEETLVQKAVAFYNIIKCIENEDYMRFDKKEKNFIKGLKNALNFQINRFDYFGRIYFEEKEISATLANFFMRHDMRLIDVVKYRSSKTDEMAFAVANKEIITTVFSKDSLKILEKFDLTDIPVRFAYIFFCMSKLLSMYRDSKIIIDGLVEDISAAADKALRAKEETKKEIEKALEPLTKKNIEQADAISRLQIENDKLRLQLDEANAQLEMLKEFNDAVSEKADELETIAEPNEEAVSYPNGTVLWGGHENWQRQFMKKHPEIKKAIGVSAREDDQVINSNIPLVLINASHMSHKSFYRYMPIIKRK
ncbi:MAG: hypothetical protein J6N21_08530, partial [Butyrivibrio sp.]|nr:hypothetical protein [Butyrivibrio sp.]